MRYSKSMKRISDIKHFSEMILPEYNKKKIGIAVIVFGIILVFGILTGTRFAYAASDKPETESSRQKCYESIMIYFGDTLESVADTYRTEEYPDVDSFISEICQINHLKEHTALVPGNYIIIPSYCSVSGQ